MHWSSSRTFGRSLCARLRLMVFDMAETSLLSRCKIHVELDEVAEAKSASSMILYEYR